jgi:Phage integrase family
LCTPRARLRRAYDELHREAAESEHPWWSLAKAIVVAALGTGLRRGELLGLRGGAVDLLEVKIIVREALVRGKTSTPKSKASRRSIELGPRTRAVLEEQWQRAAYRADDDFVFCHPHLGRPVDASKLANFYLKPALKRAGIDKPFVSSTTYVTPRSPTQPPPATRRSTSRRELDTHKARSPSATCTPLRCSSPEQQNEVRSECSVHIRQRVDSNLSASDRVYSRGPGIPGPHRRCTRARFGLGPIASEHQTTAASGTGRRAASHEEHVISRKRPKSMLYEMKWVENWVESRPRRPSSVNKKALLCRAFVSSGGRI